VTSLNYPGSNFRERFDARYMIPAMPRVSSEVIEVLWDWRNDYYKYVMDGVSEWKTDSEWEETLEEWIEDVESEE